jgi:diguanylate cyclase (GGDEF)-like protein
MSILPLLVTGYLISNYILPKVGLKVDVAASVLISIFIAFAGFFLIKEVFDRILSVSTAAKLIAAGDISQQLEIIQPDEVGDLSNALNQLTNRIRSNMDELKSYSEKTTEINLEIQRRVIVLSSLLQISSLISQGAKLEDILRLAVEKSRLLANSEVAYLLFREEGQEIFKMKVADGIDTAGLLEISVWPKEELFDETIKSNKPLVIDEHNALPKNLVANFSEKFKLTNTLALPVYLRGRVMAILGIGNSKGNFLYRKEDIELLDIFAKQVAIAVENDILMHRVEKLEIKDALTGLYNEAFIRERLQEEIKRAITCQRPCAFILFDVDNFKTFHQNFGSLHSESTLKKIASLIKDSVSGIDRVGRTADDEFAIVVPEKNKRQGQQIAEDIRKKIEFIFSEEQDSNKKITVSGGVSENPLDGIDARELMAVARELVDRAKRQGKNCIVGFKETPVCQ